MNKKIINSIVNAGGELFLVGGAVRDNILNISPQDKDYMVRKINIRKLRSILKDFGIAKIIGKSFPVVQFRQFGHETSYEISLPRKEKSTGPGHSDFEIDCSPDISVEEDLLRRDFTINAIAINMVTGDLIDPYNGKTHLKNGILKMVHENAFKEDALRILRGAQFSARFRLWADINTLNSMGEAAPLLNHISMDRHWLEIKKAMLHSERPSVFFTTLRKVNALQYIIPELNRCIGVPQDHKWHINNVFEHIMSALDSVPSTKLHVRLAALFHDIGKPITMNKEKDGNIHFYGHDLKSKLIASKTLRERWKGCPEDITKKVETLVENHMFELMYNGLSKPAIRRLIARVGEDLIYDLIDLRIGDRIGCGMPGIPMGKVGYLKREVEEEMKNPLTSIKHLQINGETLIKMGYKPGPKFKMMLEWAMEEVIQDPSKNNTNDLMKSIKANFPQGDE